MRRTLVGAAVVAAAAGVRVGQITLVEGDRIGTGGLGAAEALPVGVVEVLRRYGRPASF